MEDETNDSFEDEIDNVELSENDDSELSDDLDPDEDDKELEDGDETDDEADEIDEEPSEDDGDDDQEADDATEELSDDTEVTLSDGSVVKLGDLKDSPMLKSDHTRKTQELSNQRKAVTEKADRAEAIMSSLVDYLGSVMPPEPDISLAYTDSAKYTAQKAQYDTAMAKLSELISLADAPKEIKQEMSDEDHQRKIQDEGQRLQAMFPNIAKPEARKEFFGNVMGAATELGFTPDEVNGQADHRLFALAHWASIGMRAEKQKSVAKKKAQKAPAPKPTKAAVKGNSTRKADARKKLLADDSIENAVAFLEA